MFETGEGNLLKAELDALVNAVNLQGVMGKGIALQFKKAFPDMFLEYRRACAAGELKIGTMFVHELGTLSPTNLAPNFIINFSAKDHWRSKSRLQDIDLGLKDLATQLERRSIRSVALPALGCGLGGLNWTEVQPLIERHLEKLSEVRVVLFEPRGV